MLKKERADAASLFSPRGDPGGEKKLAATLRAAMAYHFT